MSLNPTDSWGLFGGGSLSDRVGGGERGLDETYVLDSTCLVET